MTRATLELDGIPYDVRCVRKGDGWAVTVDGQEIPVQLDRNGAGLRVQAGGRHVHVDLGREGLRIDGKPRAWRVLDVPELDDGEAAHGAHAAHVRPPMNGKLERLLVSPGQVVAKGDVLFILEAMKMQNEVRAPIGGRVAAVHLQAGATVEPRQVVLDLEPA